MLATMKEFSIWLLARIPAFLMSEPICYFVGILITLWILKVIFVICGYKQ